MAAAIGDQHGSDWVAMGRVTELLRAGTAEMACKWCRWGVARYAQAEALCARLSERVGEALTGVAHIDRISFRPKSLDSFLDKADRRDEWGSLKYVDPLREIEDQIGGRVIVFFRDDIPIVADLLANEFGPVEAVHREPAGDAEFGYESEHFIFVIPSHLKPAEWLDDARAPVTFEMQVRTLFMHAWAEPQHDIGYKPDTVVPTEMKRRLAWVAASAWGADQVLNDIARSNAKPA